MTKKEKQARRRTLLELAAFGGLNPTEEAELQKLSDYLENPATEGQVDYIEVLLGKLGANLSDYTETELDYLTGEEASDLIDQLKDDVTDAGAWEN